jgi:hypothetical protein
MDLLGKRLGDIKRNLIFDNVVASSAELVRHCFDGHNRVALGFLFLIEAFDLRIKADRKIGGLHKRPGQILVAVFCIAASFTLAVADFGAPHTATVRSVIADTGKSLDLSGLQHNGQRQDGPDSGYRL